MRSLRKSRLTLALMCALPALACAQQGLQLRPQPSILDIPQTNADETPLYLEADRMQGYSEREIEASGNARMRKHGQAFFADWMRHDRRENELYAIGNVRMEQGAETMEGSRLRYNLDTDRGLLENSRYLLNPKGTGNLPIAGVVQQDGRGTAERIVFEGPGLFRAQQATYTTCEPGNDDWYLRSRDLLINKDTDIGTARDAYIDFKGATIFYSPYLSFSLHQQRKSGFLTPHYGNTSTSGFEASVPYYWNIAPNMDATFTPRLMSKRGLQLRSEFRYLDPRYNGEVNYEFLPNDNQLGRDRQALKLRHTQTFANGWSGALDIQHVSDAKYFTDMSTQIALTSQTFLPRQGTLSRGGVWGTSGIYSFSALVQSWQTLQTDPLAPLTPPYSRRPQLTLTAQNQNVLGGDFDLYSDFSDFSHPTLVNGRRLVAYPSLTFPLQTSYAYLTPKIGVHTTRYFLGENNSTGLQDKTRALPIFSAESGLIFERNANIFGNAYTQTLEPKAYYVYIPYRDQSQLPNFESGLQDINFATIFSENQFSGQDRINDANQLTLGVTSRLINPGSGVELLRVGLAQRYYFSPQRVTLPGVAPRSNQSSRSDLLAALSGTIASHWTADFGWQYNTDSSQTQRMSVATRYQPQQGKLLNLSYRHQVDSFKQFDISAQWPIAGKWTAVGRWNYSMQDKRLLEGVAGVEYDGGCWAFRIVAHRLSTATQTSTTAMFFELELNGVTRVGSNPLDILRRNISGYSRYDPRAPRPSEYYVPER